MESRCLKTNRNSGQRNRLYRKLSVPNLQHVKLIRMSDCFYCEDLEQGTLGGLSACLQGSLPHCRSPQVPPDTPRSPPYLSLRLRLCAASPRRLLLSYAPNFPRTQPPGGRQHLVSLIMSPTTSLLRVLQSPDNQKFYTQAPHDFLLPLSGRAGAQRTHCRPRPGNVPSHSTWASHCFPGDGGSVTLPYNSPQNCDGMFPTESQRGLLN